jgi:AcrR family transcriptional regulator
MHEERTMRRSASPGPAEEDLTARARIRDAAIACFAAAGVAATSVRTVAAAAGVSPGLVIHHFGSKDGLRVACDQHIVRVIDELKTQSNEQGLGMDPLALLREWDTGPPILRYLARTLVDGSPHVSELLDALVADGVTRMREAVAKGLIRPYPDEPARAAVIAAWSLGALVLHEHLARLLGEDVTGPMSAAPRFVGAHVDIMGHGLMTEPMYELLSQGFPPTSTPEEEG